MRTCSVLCSKDRAQQPGCSCHEPPPCPYSWRRTGRTVAAVGWARETEASGPQPHRQKVTELQPLRDSMEMFSSENTSSDSQKTLFFHKTTRTKSQFSIQKMLMENLCPAMLLNTDWRYLDFWGKEGQVIFTV